MDDLLLENGTDRLMQEDGTSTLLLEFNPAVTSTNQYLTMVGCG